jgi:hypothetical protein
MTHQNAPQKYRTSRELLLSMIERYLEAHPEKSHQSFGWAATRDSGLVERLRQGKDVTTRVMDNVLHYLEKNNGVKNHE